MSPSPDLRQRLRQARHSSHGFTLIEVIVALGILAIVSAALYPQVIIGLKATGLARDVTQAKGVAQARLEQMRAMPFYVGREAGDYIDILDTYYRNTAPPTVTPVCGPSMSALPATGWTGFVNTAAPHCPWEPSGPLYRKVINPIASPGLGEFAMVVSTQFLTGATPPVAVNPLPGYNSQTAGADQPSSSQVGVTVTVFYRAAQGVKYSSTFTQIERSTAIDPLIQSKAKVATVQVSSSARTWATWDPSMLDPAETNQDQPNLLANIGLVDLTGELFTGSRTIASATGAAGSTSLPSAVTGAFTNLVAPVDVAGASSTAPEVGLPNGCRWICFGPTRTDQVSAASSGGLPNAGSPTTPVRSLVPAGATRDGFWFDNGKWRDKMKLRSNEPMVSLDTSAGSAATVPGVRDCTVGGSGAMAVPAHLLATGYLTSTAADTADPEVTACGTAQSGTVRVFSTQFAPNGVLRISVANATAHCQVRTKGSNSASAAYQATVQYWNGSGYTTVSPIRDSNTSDPLDGVNLAQVIDASSGLTLGDYVQSWSSLTRSEVRTDTQARTAEVNVPGVITLFTGPTRTFSSGWGANNADATSAISVTVGAVSCKAGDWR